MERVALERAVDLDMEGKGESEHKCLVSIKHEHIAIRDVCLILVRTSLTLWRVTP